MPLVAHSAPPILATMQPPNANHHSVAPADLEVLDMLCAMPSNFPHSGPSYYAGSGAPSPSTKSRPLSTLNALRRPPIDPMVLAASLSSGPHVTRHHFHHSFGSDHQHAKHSKQMPASQRVSLQTQHQQQQQQQPQPQLQPQPQATRARKLSAGSYANCDLDEFANEPGTSVPKVEPVPEVTDEERALYASRQAPRSVRLQREQQQLKALQGSSSASGPAPVEPAAATAAALTAKQKEVQSASDIRASDEPARPKLLNQPGNLAAKSARTANSPADAVARTLDERKAAVVAHASPSLGTLPAPGVVSATPSIPTTPLNRPSISSIVRPPPLSVRCHARTRIPTPHGEIFCHLYRNNYDAKEHLALVIDPAQNDEESLVLGGDGRPVKEKSRRYRRRALRSKTLDEVWGPQESVMERIVRGAYVGRLGPSFQVPSLPVDREAHGAKGGDHGESDDDEDAEDEPPLVRIHSECYTGETIGSQRCDCGEQLDEAIRLISQGSGSSAGSSGSRSHSRPHSHSDSHGQTRSPLPPRGVVVYLRQEGRGIGLLDKLMAYNLQDMGHDTVSANILLGHLPDARKYDIASAILQDLGVGECRLLTNNPEKMEALEAEGVRVTERVGMVPRVWKYRKFVRDKAEKKAKAKIKAKARAAQKTKEAKIKAGAGAASRRDKRVEASPLRAALHRSSGIFPPGSPAAMDASMISQAASASEEEDPVALGLCHQGEDVLLDSQYASASSSEDEDDDDEYNEDEDEDDDDNEEEEYINSVLRKSGATMIGGSITKSVELEKYLRTKVEKMGHLLTLPTSSPASASANNRMQQAKGEIISQPNSEDEQAV
ncbi:GTP cyclohydrolase II [Thecaphora frezii]